MSLKNLRFETLKARPAATGFAAVARGKKYRALLNGKAFKRGEEVEVTYAGTDKITFMASRASVSMLPADFLNAFIAVEDSE